MPVLLTGDSPASLVQADAVVARSQQQMHIMLEDRIQFWFTLPVGGDGYLRCNNDGPLYIPPEWLGMLHRTEPQLP